MAWSRLKLARLVKNQILPSTYLLAEKPTGLSCEQSHSHGPTFRDSIFSLKVTGIPC